MYILISGVKGRLVMMVLIYTVFEVINRDRLDISDIDIR